MQPPPVNPMRLTRAEGRVVSEETKALAVDFMRKTKIPRKMKRRGRRGYGSYLSKGKVKASNEISQGIREANHAFRETAIDAWWEARKGLIRAAASTEAVLAMEKAYPPRPSLTRRWRSQLRAAGLRPDTIRHLAAQLQDHRQGWRDDGQKFVLGFLARGPGKRSRADYHEYVLQWMGGLMADQVRETMGREGIARRLLLGPAEASSAVVAGVYARTITE